MSDPSRPIWFEPGGYPIPSAASALLGVPANSVRNRAKAGYIRYHEVAGHSGFHHRIRHIHHRGDTEEIANALIDIKPRQSATSCAESIPSVDGRHVRTADAPTHPWTSWPKSAAHRRRRHVADRRTGPRRTAASGASPVWDAEEATRYVDSHIPQRDR